MRIDLWTPDSADDSAWIDGLRARLTGAEVRRRAPHDDSTADYLVAWKPPAELFRNLAGVRAVFALGAGVDAMLATVPASTPLVRLDDAGMGDQMARYVAHAVLRARIGFDAVAPCADWASSRAAFDAAGGRDFAVGVLGLGVLGARVATALAALGLETHGWSRTPKSIPGVVCHDGPAGLDALLARSHALVNLLPLTPATENLLDARLFAKLPRGAALVNVARGAHVVDDDLLAALDSGRLAHATLDVFRTEPLPAEHAFWRHPRVTVTPHISARTLRGPALDQIAAKIRALEMGAPVSSLPGYVERSRGY